MWVLVIKERWGNVLWGGWKENWKIRGGEKCVEGKVLWGNLEIWWCEIYDEWDYEWFWLFLRYLMNYLLYKLEYEKVNNEY